MKKEEKLEKIMLEAINYWGYSTDRRVYFRFTSSLYFHYTFYANPKRAILFAKNPIGNLKFWELKIQESYENREGYLDLCVINGQNLKRGDVKNG